MATSFRRRLGPVTVWACVSLLLGMGCVSEHKKSPAISAPAGGGGGTIFEINLLAIPVALNLDNAPGVDGFVIKVFASRRDRPKPVPLEKGQLEVIMFDGIPGVTTAANAQPHRIWTYTMADLKPLQIESSIGTGYQIAPLWQDAKPTASKISVVVRYTPPKGPAIVSAPSIISVALK